MGRLAFGAARLSGLRQAGGAVYDDIMDKFAHTPEPPYYAVVFSSLRNADDDDKGYSEMADHMWTLAAEQLGYLGMETVRGEDGFGITVSYWVSLDAIRNWRRNAEHKIAQELGKAKWYEKYQLRVCLVENAYGIERS